MTTHLQPDTNLWEGVFAADFTLDRVRRYSHHLGSTMLAGNLSCLVAYDTRFMSNLFAHDIYRHLLGLGVAASLVSAAAPLPAIHLILDREKIDCGLVVSARNRPYWYNGLVLLQRSPVRLSLEQEESDVIAGEVAHTQPFPAPAESSPPGQVLIDESTLDVRRPYLDMLRGVVDVTLIRRSTLTIFADPMHGTVAGYMPAIIGEGSQTKAIEINRETDPLFGKTPPLPAEANLSRLRKLVRESDSHIGLAFSADGTALGVVDKNGDQLEQLEIVLVLASYLASQYRQKGVVIAPPPVVGSALATTLAGRTSWEDDLGFKVELTRNANVRIADVLSSEPQNLLVGCTTSGEMMMSKYTRYPDAMIAGLLLVELVARNGGSLRASLDSIHARLDALE